MKHSLIYHAHCQESGKGYVGKAVDFQRRKSQHLKTTQPSAFHSAIDKYGQDSFVWAILESNLAPEIVDEREVYWIKEKGTLYPNGYNIARGGQGGLLSKEIKAKREQEEDERIANLNADFTQDTVECPLCSQNVLFAYNHTIRPFKPIFNPLYTCACVFHGHVKLIIKERE